MFQLSACADTLYLDIPFIERAQQLASAGFWVEFWDWHDRDIEALAADPNIRISSMLGCVAYQEGGCIMHPDGVNAFVKGVHDCLPVAQKLGCNSMVLLAGSLDENGHGNHLIAEHPATRWITAYKGLCQVAEFAEKHNLAYNLEVLNLKRDHPGYSLPYFEDTVCLVEQVGSPRIKILLDIYHTQIQEGNVVEIIQTYHDFVGYVHVADVPGRHEPGTGEINYPRIAKALHEVGYDGTIGLEAYPAGEPQLALESFRAVFAM